MTHPAGPSEQVAALFSERQRFESWLTTLESKRATTPSHIYARVHADYTARLQRIIEQLGQHRAALLELESSLTERLTALDVDEAKQRDEAAEADLRAAVGELSPQHHREIVERTEAAIGDIEDERRRVQAELTHLRVLIDAGRALGTASAVEAMDAEGAEPAPASPRASGPAEVAREEPEWESSPASGGSAAATPVSKSGAGFDDLEFIKSVTGPSHTSSETSPVGNGARSGDASRAAAGASASKTEASTATATPSPTANQAIPPAKPKVIPTSQIAAAPASGLPLIMPEQDARSGTEEAAPSGRTSQPLPAYLKDSPPEQVKTLKCQECGTLNYPTEWYCERCGAELAAL